MLRCKVLAKGKVIVMAGIENELVSPKYNPRKHSFEAMNLVKSKEATLLSFIQSMSIVNFPNQSP
jgi:hypothetical protein